MARTWKPTVAGILCLVSGVLGIICIPITWFFFGMLLIGDTNPSGIEAVLFVAFPVLAALISILAIVGGSFAHMRMRRRWALAGSIASILTPGIILGIIAFALLSESESEFNGEPTDYEGETPTDDKVYDVCPSCGSSNINKAVKRMPKSQKEIDTLGFKTEWGCLCFNCRFEWVEKEKP